MRENIDKVLAKLRWMREERIWPNGVRYLWTDAFGVTLLISLRNELHDDRFLAEAERVVADVNRVLGRPIGLRIGQQADRDGQYYHYLAMWLFALTRLGQIKSEYRENAIQLVRAIHPRFVIPRVGVLWKMREDLSGLYPGFGFGALDPFHGLVVYRLLDSTALNGEIAQLQDLVERSYRDLNVKQDLGLGMLLWMSHFFPDESWAATLSNRSKDMLDRMWIDPPGYFCREPTLPQIKFAFTNYGVAIGLQAVRMHADRVEQINRLFDTYRSGDSYDRDAITHVMSCCSLFPGELLRIRG
jgi:hypothetical protein